MKKLAIIGASGHGKVVADIAKKNGYDKIVFLDDDCTIQECGGYPVVGNTDAAVACGCDVFVGIGNAKTRQRIQKTLEAAGVNIPSLIHPNAVFADDAVIGTGTVIMAGAVVNSGAYLGKGCIINTCASVDHDCRLEDYVHVSVGAHLAGSVTVGERTWVGIGTVVSNNLCIAGDCLLGAGTVVVHNIEKPGTYVGVPAKKIK